MIQGVLHKAAGISSGDERGESKHSTEAHAFTRHDVSKISTEALEIPHG